MSRTFRDVPIDRRLELPVMEDSQLGMATGMALAGMLPICCYPRWSFLLLATNQLVLHLDKLRIYGNGYAPKVIIRVAIPTFEPLDPGIQHLGDFSAPYRHMLQSVRVVDLDTAEEIVPAYRRALEAPHGGSIILVERAALYGD
jgi:pyruvate/2-oxoglutarate/acetoin dehydrogenase E1 component